MRKGVLNSPIAASVEVPEEARNTTQQTLLFLFSPGLPSRVGTLHTNGTCLSSSHTICHSGSQTPADQHDLALYNRKGEVGRMIRLGLSYNT